MCRQFRSRDCKNLDTFLHVTTRPIIETSSNMRFGCWDFHYEVGLWRTNTHTWRTNTHVANHHTLGASAHVWRINTYKALDKRRASPGREQSDADAWQ